MTRVGAALVALGLGLIALIQMSQSVAGLGLYDGLNLDEPYRYVAPAAGQLGGPNTAMSTLTADGQTSPTMVVATSEQPPQAQLIAKPGTFAISPAVTGVTVTVTPVAPSSAEAAGATIVGNVYRYAVVDQAGNPLALAPGGEFSVVLRSPSSHAAVAIARWDGAAWQQLTTGQGPSAGIFNATASELGDYALLPGASNGSLWLVGVLLLVVLGVVIAVLLLRRSGRAAPGQPVEAAGPASSIRKQSRRRKKGQR